MKLKGMVKGSYLTLQILTVEGKYLCTTMDLDSLRACSRKYLLGCIGKMSKKLSLRTSQTLMHRYTQVTGVLIKMHILSQWDGRDLSL